MSLLEVTELYNLISRGSQNANSRMKSRQLRKVALGSIVLGQGFEKLAFDTRRINQETDYIPRRGLQNYHRSEKFISDSIAAKIVAFKRLSNILDILKMEFEKNSEWQDSYTRVLSSTIHKGLRTIEADDDFSDSQPSMASLAYLEELLYVRYRLTMDSLAAMSDDELRNVILKKDELLTRNHSSEDNNFEIKPSDISKNSYDQMMNKMLTTMAQVMSSYKPPQQDDNLTTKLFDVKATKDSPEIERTVTITIKDKIVDKDKPVDNIKIADEKIETEVKEDLEK
jgi:hypothetical protein